MGPAPIEDRATDKNFRCGVLYRCPRKPRRLRPIGERIVIDDRPTTVSKKPASPALKSGEKPARSSAPANLWPEFDEPRLYSNISRGIEVSISDSPGIRAKIGEISSGKVLGGCAAKNKALAGIKAVIRLPSCHISVYRDMRLNNEKTLLRALSPMSEGAKEFRRVVGRGLSAPEVHELRQGV